MQLFLLVTFVFVCLVGTTGLTWLAFYPPQRFQEWMRARQGATAPPRSP
jgi:hypothetical protein